MRSRLLFVSYFGCVTIPCCELARIEVPTMKSPRIASPAGTLSFTQPQSSRISTVRADGRYQLFGKSPAVLRKNTPCPTIERPIAARPSST